MYIAYTLSRPAKDNVDMSTTQNYNYTKTLWFLQEKLKGVQTIRDNDKICQISKEFTIAE